MGLEGHLLQASSPITHSEVWTGSKGALPPGNRLQAGLTAAEGLQGLFELHDGGAHRGTFQGNTFNSPFLSSLDDADRSVQRS